MKGGGRPREIPTDPGAVAVQLPRSFSGPLRVFARRLLLAVALTLVVALTAYLGRDGYRDATEDELSFLDALYYATVSITTTGYGDITPITDGARLATILIITPARILFLILLVGTTVEILAERTREAFERTRWRARLEDHTIICGFGTKGRTAAETLCSHGVDPDRIVVIDLDDSAAAAANRLGVAVVRADASRVEVLREAGIDRAASVIVAPHNDAQSVLITLTARELNPRATIVAAVREEENAHLLRQGGADSVITSSSAAGRLLGIATRQPRVVEVLEDLLSVGKGLDVYERRVEPDEAGRLIDLHVSGPVVAVQRDGETFRFDDPRVAEVRAGDTIVQIRSHGGD